MGLGTAASDGELLSAARTGDRAALATLIERHQAQVYRFGLRMCRDPEDAQDVLQDTLLALARGIRDFRGASSLSTWLFTVARSYCIKKRRRSKFAPREASFEDTSATITDPGRAPDEALAAKRVERTLEQAIAELDVNHREVLVLRDLEGLTAAEVAEVLGITVQAVKSRLHRARAAVREQVAAVLDPPGRVDATSAACPDVLTLFSQHLEGEIGQDTCLEMERHLERCPRCSSVCESLKRTLALCKTADAAVDVPPAVQQVVQQALLDFIQTAR